MKKHHTARNTILGLLVLGLVVTGVLALTASKDSNSPKRSAPTGSSTQKIDQTPGTDTDQSIADKSKGDDSQNNINRVPPSDSSNNDKRAVPIVITVAYPSGAYQSVNGYVDGVVESGGTCTLTMTDSAGKTISSSRAAEPDVSTTTCGQSQIALSKLHSGKWQATLSYSSKLYSGISSPREVVVN